MDTLAQAVHRARPTRPWLGVVVAFALGFLVMPTLGGIAHGDVETFAVVGFGAFVAVLLRPGWAALIANAAGLTAYVTVIAAMAGFAGLQYLGLALMLPAVAAGASCATVVNHVFEDGLTAALADARVWAAAAIAVVLTSGLLWFYLSLVGSGSPP